MNAWFLGASLAMTSAMGVADEVDRWAQLRELRAALNSTAPQPWESIAWRTDLADARSEARTTGKPLFLWAMNGHPLGCT